MSALTNPAVRSKSPAIDPKPIRDARPSAGHAGRHQLVLTFLQPANTGSSMFPAGTTMAAPTGKGSDSGMETRAASIAAMRRRRRAPVAAAGADRGAESVRSGPRRKDTARSQRDRSQDRGAKWDFKMVDYTESGVLTTASDLLFSGGKEGNFFALDARNGELLWQSESRRDGRERSDNLPGERPAVRGGLRRQCDVCVRAARLRPNERRTEYRKPGSSGLPASEIA